MSPLRIGLVLALLLVSGCGGGGGGDVVATTYSSIFGLTVDNAGNLYVSDQNYTKIRKIVTSTGVVTTISATF